MKKPKQMQFTYGGEVYTYELYLGGVKRLNLRIRPDGSIRMSAPRLTSQREIDTFLTRYGDRIAAAVARARQKTPPDISLSSSKQELIQKKEQLLAIIQSCHQSLILPRFSNLSIPMTDRQRRYIQSPTAIRIRVMKTRWGSCNFSKGTLNFNLNLIDQPTECIEYVVMHEFAHLIQPDHSYAYHALMDRLMPDWRIRRKKLNGK